MAEVITCPECKRTLQVPATYFGQTVQCPECRSQFVARADSAAVQTASAPKPPTRLAPAPAYEDLNEDEAPRRRRRDDDDELDDLPRIRQSTIPHRGGLILAMGLLALLMFPYATVVCGPMAWQMGNTDLAEIREGRMDPSGEGLIQAGRLLGIVSTALFGLFAIAVCAFFGLLIAR
jgi:hypothetical protein